MTRPNPLQWIWYTFGGRLGPLYSGWVLHDTTGRTRWLRQAVRAVVQVVPPAAVVLALLGFSWLAWAGVGCGALLALWYSLAYIDSTAERRLVKHGYEPGTLKRRLYRLARPAKTPYTGSSDKSLPEPAPKPYNRHEPNDLT